MEWTVTDHDALSMDGETTVRVEGYYERDRGTHPNAILVTYESNQLTLQFSIDEFTYDDERDMYVPSTDPNSTNLYTKQIHDSDYEPLPRNIIMYPLYEHIVIAVYNEWRKQHNLDWDETITQSAVTSPPVSINDEIH